MSERVTEIANAIASAVVLSTNRRMFVVCIEVGEEVHTHKGEGEAEAAQEGRSDVLVDLIKRAKALGVKVDCDPEVT